MSIPACAGRQACFQTDVRPDIIAPYRILSAQKRGLEVLKPGLAPGHRGNFEFPAVDPEKEIPIIKNFGVPGHGWYRMDQLQEQAGYRQLMMS